MVVKKKVTKKGSSGSIKSKLKDVSFLDKKKNVSLVNFVRFLIFFIIFLVLYFVPSNPILNNLFIVGALITGVLTVTFLLIFVGVFLYIRTHKKKH